MIEVGVSLEVLIRSDLGEGKRVGSRSFWLCPFHQDRNPSFTITPDGKHWKCFGCQKHGDAIAWVRERHGVSFYEAIKYLGGGVNLFCSSRTESNFSSPGPRRISPPNAEWIAKADEAAAGCALIFLETRDATHVMDALCDRGLTPDTIYDHMIGYNPKHQELEGLYVRQGITIPWRQGGSVHGIKVRQPFGLPKYVWVGGSRRSGLYLGEEIQPGLPTLIVEGEFDALLGAQLMRDYVNVVTLGSASESPDQQAVAQLEVSPLILICYDNDPAGIAGARRWTSLSSRVRLVRLPRGKDLTDFWRAGGDLREWIYGVLHENTTYPTRHPTVGANA